MEAIAMEQTAPDTEAAYAKLTKVKEGTQEHCQALGAFLSSLFPDGQSPIRQESTSNPAVNLPPAPDTT